jgi:hypothetical protein
MANLARRLPPLAALLASAGLSCVEAPPPISAIGTSTLAIRLFVFGADAEDSDAAFRAVHKNNPGFSVVPDGGDAEVLVGLEKDSTQCVEPTALCSYRLSYRIRSPKGEVLHSENTTILADSDSCTRLCDKALNKVAVLVVEAAAAVVKGGKPAPAPAGSVTPAPSAGPVPSPSASAAPAASASASPAPSGSVALKPGEKPPEPKPVEPPGPRPAPTAGGICSVGEGPRLPAKEAEKRVAQVDALKRLGILTEAEFDCLSAAYLARL